MVLWRTPNPAGGRIHERAPAAMTAGLEESESFGAGQAAPR